MHHSFRALSLGIALVGVSLVSTTDNVFAAAGAPPSSPIEAPSTGADLKHACGQNIDGFSDRVGESVLRAMLVVQCRAVVAAVVELVNSGQYEIDGAPVWKCVENREDYDALAATYVQWVGRQPPLMRKPASMAFVEAIEMSAKCPN